MVKAIFFDIDGTLVSFRTHRAPESTVRALHALREKGIKIFLASGRMPGQTAFLERQVPVRFDGSILLNGQYCLDGAGQVLRQEAIPAAGFAELLPYLENTGIAVSFMEIDRIYLNRVTDAVWELRRQLGNTAPLEALGDPNRALAHPIYQLNAYIPPEAEAEFLRHLPGAKTARWCPWFTDIIPADGGKPVGVEVLCAHFGIDPADTMAFGDGGNDAEMLRCVGLGVAMGNGDAAAKASADYITGDIDEDGLAGALRHLGVL